MIRKIGIALAVGVVLCVAGAAVLAAYVVHQVEGAYFDADGVRLHYTEDGSGEPVVLVHGFAVNADVNWRKPGIIRALAKDHRVIAIDNRAHGRSDRPEDAAQYGIEMVEDVVRLLDHLDIEKAHVVGYSMGGFITLKLLTMHPDRLLSAVPCGAGWIRADQDRMQLMQGVVESLEAGEGIRPLMNRLRPGRQLSRVLERFVVNTFVVHMHDQEALARAFGSLPALEVTEEELRRNTVPVLCIVGSDDPLKAGVDALAGVLPDLETIVLEGANHGNAVLRTQFRRGLKRFLGAHRGHVAPTEGVQAAAP